MSPAVIDPFVPCPPGRYTDDLVSVVREPASSGEPPGRDGLVTRTAHFSLRRRGRRAEVAHRLPPDALDNDLAGLLAGELFAPGWLSGTAVFERVFTGVVRSMVDDPVRAWDAFYGNTLRRIRRCWRAPDPWADEPHSSIAGIAPVYRRAMRLVPPGTVLDLGSCFGFLALLLAERGDGAVIASDIAPGTMRLLARMARLRGLPVGTQVCDAARVPLPDAAVDTVTVIHVLEHLEPGQGTAVLREALRLARRRVVVAVPFEDEPTAAYGHLRTFGPADLAGLGLGSGRRFTVEEHHGGWLVLDA